jgi:uncharacterized membrane protein
MLVLAGVAVLVLGFLARLNPLLVVVTAALVTGVLGAISAGSGLSLPALGHALVATLEQLGKAYNADRFVSVVWLILPVIGLLEREGLQERARRLIGRLRAATPGRLLIAYMMLRQVTAALGLTAMMGHAQTIRPLIAPMAEGALDHEGSGAPVPEALKVKVRAFAAATDNVAVFFGEDIFLAVSSILLMVAALQGMGVKVQPLQLSLWAIPSAVLALLVHGARLLLLDRSLRRDLAASQEPSA